MRRSKPQSGNIMMHRPGVKSAIDPDRSPSTVANLPPTTTKRWVARRKAEVVSAVLFDGRLPAEEFVDGKRVTATSLFK